MKKHTPKEEERFFFKNNKGRVIVVKGSATIGDLVKLGMSDFSLQPDGTPVPDGYFATVPVKTIKGNKP